MGEGKKGPANKIEIGFLAACWTKTTNIGLLFMDPLMQYNMYDDHEFSNLKMVYFADTVKSWNGKWTEFAPCRPKQNQREV